MKITPRTEEDFKSRNLLQPGIYNFIVFDAIEKTSKNSGEPMIEVILKIVDSNNREFKIFDYLIDREPMDYKIRHICDCGGDSLIQKYQSGNIESSDLYKLTGKAKIIIRKDKTGQFGDRNSVQDYIPTSNKVEEEFNDKIPF